MTEEEKLREFEEFEELRRERLGGGVGADRGKSLLSGATEGVVGMTLGLPGDVNSILENVPGYKELPWLLKGPGALMPTTKDITRAAGDITGLPFDYDPTTPSGKYTKAISSGVAGGLLPIGRIPWLLRGVAGAAGGAGGEAVSHYTGSGAAGAGTNMLLSSLIQSLGVRKPQIVKTLQKDLGSLGADKKEVESALKAASDKAADIEAQTGVRPVLSQTIPEKSTLSGIAEEVQRSPEGQGISRTLAEELLRGRELVGGQLDQLSKLPISQGTANQILRAGDKALKRPQEVARAAADRSYRAGKRDKMPTQDRGVFENRKTEKIRDIYDQEGNWKDFETQTGKGRVRTGTEYDATPNEGNRTDYRVHPNTVASLIERLQKRADDLSLTDTRSGKPFERAASDLRKLARRNPDGVPYGQIDVIQREAATLAEQADTVGASGKSVFKKLANQSVSGIINDVLKEGSPALARGKDIYSTMAKGYLDQVNKSALPDMFTVGARQSGRGDYSVMGQIISDSARYSPGDIRFVATNLRKADSQAFPALVKQVWSEKWEAAMKNSEGRAPQQALNDWTNSVTGVSGSSLRKNYLETIRQVHIAQGSSPAAADAAARGADAVASALETFSRDRGAVGQVNVQEMQRAAGGNLASSAAKSASTLLTWPAAKAFERVLWKRTYAKIADALTSPEGAQKLVEISQFSQPERAAEAFIRSLVQAENQAMNF